MRDSFITENFTLDLSNVQTSYMEENPRFSDRFFTKYSLPFEFYLDRDLRIHMGHYDNLNVSGLEKKYVGYHTFEGRIKTGTLEILEVEGSLVRAQIDSGFEELPNFEKKLRELSLGTVNVADIYQHANDLCAKKYPETNYNFPRIIYNKHQSSEAGWEVFNQFINDRDESGFIDNNEDGSDWNEKPESQRTDADKLHKNRNIIHPMPYVLYVLKRGFSDAGYELTGDILSDDDFMQRVVFHPEANYFTGKSEDSINIQMSEKDYTKIFKNHGRLMHCSYVFSLNIPKGYFLLQGTVKFNFSRTMSSQLLGIYLNGRNILSNTERSVRTLNVFLPFENNEDNAKFQIITNKLTSVEQEDESPVFLDLRINNRNVVNEDGTKINLINNRNAFSLSEFVPDMTFGDFVRTLKNWKNFDIDVVANTVVMNYLSTESIKTMKDISDFEIETPVKTFVKRRSFNISFPKLDNNTQNNAFVDIDGVKLGGASRNETTEIEINGYCLPLETYRGKTTAAIKSEDNSILGLVYYDGLSKGQNFAKNPGGLMLPDILSVLHPWYQMRIVSNEFRWKFYANKNKWHHVGIKDTLYVYGRKVWIKEITKTVIDERLYQIEIAVESIS